MFSGIKSNLSAILRMIPAFLSSQLFLFSIHNIFIMFILNLINYENGIAQANNRGCQSVFQNLYLLCIQYSSLLLSCFQYSQRFYLHQGTPSKNIEWLRVWDFL